MITQMPGHSILPAPQADARPRVASGRIDRRTWFRACALAGLGSICQRVLAQGAQPNFYATFSGMRLLDQSGRSLSVQNLLDKVVLVNFIYTACSTVCPVQTHALVQLQRQLKPALRQRVHLLSVSLDPLSDTPQTLHAFAKRFGVDFGNWSFVTGRPDDIHRLAEALWLFRDGKANGPLDEHNTSLWLVDAQGELRVRFAGNPPDVARLERELDTLSQQAASGRHAPSVARR